ncbi:MAG: RNA polymerase sigma factor [Myxococcales bacterium]|nr:RNA polymerase sigma factor [Myxococcales bacterium]
MSDEELLSRFQAGEAPAFGTLLVRYRAPLYNFILRYVSNSDTAADLLQDAFAKVIQSSASFHEQSKFSTWMYTIARNVCIDHLRKQKHRRHASLDASRSGDSTPPLAERVPGASPEVDRQAAGARMRERIAEAVEALPHEQREVFLLRQVQHLPFAQIAEVVGASENTVKSRMRYALERLQEALADYEDYVRAQA